SPTSGLAITSKRARTSAIVRAMGPTTPIQEKAPAPGGKCPVAGTRPGVGFSPQIPQKCAGTRIEPPPSLPTPPAEQPAAIAGSYAEQVVGFVRHQKFGSVGIPEKDGASRL